MCKKLIITSGFAFMLLAWNPSFTQAQQTKETLKTFPSVNLKDVKTVDKSTYILFDGSSLEGWRGYAKDHLPNKWSIENGTLKFTSKPAIDKAEGGDIIFAHPFKNFELTFQWKVSKAGNSGVFYLAKEIPGQPIYVSAPEYQILDNEHHADAKMGVDGNRMSASLYDMIPAKPQNSLPYGEWNTSKIHVYKGKVTHYQNDVKVLEYSLWDDSWKELLDASKFNKEKSPVAYDLLMHVGGKDKSGYIGFQDHGDDVWFKDITVKVLK